MRNTLENFVKKERLIQMIKTLRFPKEGGERMEEKRKSGQKRMDNHNCMYSSTLFLFWCLFDNLFCSDNHGKNSNSNNRFPGMLQILLLCRGISLFWSSHLPRWCTELE